MDSISLFFVCVFWHMQLYISWYIISFLALTLLLKYSYFLSIPVLTSSIDVVFILSIERTARQVDILKKHNVGQIRPSTNITKLAEYCPFHPSITSTSVIFMPLRWDNHLKFIKMEFWYLTTYPAVNLPYICSVSDRLYTHHLLKRWQLHIGMPNMVSMNVRNKIISKQQTFRIVYIRNTHISRFQSVNSSTIYIKRKYTHTILPMSINSKEMERWHSGTLRSIFSVSTQ